MIEILLDLAYYAGAFFLIVVGAVIALGLAALSDARKKHGRTLTGCHLDDREEMVTRRFVSAEDINPGQIDLPHISKTRRN